MASYAEIMTKYRASQVRVDRLKKKLAEETTRTEAAINEESTLQAQLLVELQQHISGEIGQDVRIGGKLIVKSDVPKPKYEREKILARIIELRESKTSFDEIARILNSEGFKPLSAEQFSNATVYQLHKGYMDSLKKKGPQEPVEAAAAAK